MYSKYSKFWPKGGLPGILHHFTENLVTFEFTPGTVRKPNSLVFIGGLGDGLATTSYVADVVATLNHSEWSLFTLILTSSYQGWGLGHLDRDVDELAQCIQYIKDYKTTKFGTGKIVIMGHSTGSQDVLHYLSRPNPLTSHSTFDPSLRHIKRLAVDGAIMQAAVSDREVIMLLLGLKDGWGNKTQKEMEEIYEKLVSISKKAEEAGKACDTILPLDLTNCIYPWNTPLSCRRFLSLVSPDSPEYPSEDDLFSSDLGVDRLTKTFGMVKTQKLLRGKLLVLLSGADQSVPDWVNKEELLSRWRNAMDHGNADCIWDEVHSGIIRGASHALSDDDQAECRQELCNRVWGFLQLLQNSFDS